MIKIMYTSVRNEYKNRTLILIYYYYMLLQFVRLKVGKYFQIRSGLIAIIIELDIKLKYIWDMLDMSPRNFIK